MKIVRLSRIGVALLAAASCGADGPSGPTIPTLASFTTGTWPLRVERAWDQSSFHPQFSSDTIPDSAYTSVTGGPVTVSSGGQHATITGVRVAGISAGALQAVRVRTTSTSVEYDISQGVFAGGRLVVWSSGGGLQAEVTIYGSGVPIIQSERGRLLAAG